VECHVGLIDKVPEHTSRVAYAIAREAVTNALRHGRGRVRMDVAVGSDLVLSVENEAAVASSTVDRREGRGLVGMRMRARLVGGTCEWREVDGTWGVQATLPLRAK
jgi:signal transduction histidine kinase